MSGSLYIAVDLGAGSGRVFLAGVDEGELLLEQMRRFHYPPRHEDGHLRWDVPLMLTEIVSGLQSAAEWAHALGRPVRSIGIDSWAVDYGLTDAQGHLLENPVCYRDARTNGVMDDVFACVPRADLFERTGIQFLTFNTVYQLVAHARAGIPAAAARLLLIPDLVASQLTGRAVSERTNSTTTQLVNANTGTWDAHIISRLGLPAHLLCAIVPAGTTVGALRPALARQTGLADVPVVAPATHDTASAVAGIPLDDDWAYISSGTWSLVGIELPQPLINARVAHDNFTNEGGAFGTTRFLKNVMGLWILESCRAEWSKAGVAADYDVLVRGAADGTDCQGVIFPDDPRFLNPSSMLDAIAEQLGETGQSVPGSPVALTRVILDSLALRYASILSRIESLTGRPLRGIHIVGGGSRNGYLNQATANATRLTVVAGPVEATVIGNVLVQAVAAGRFGSLSEARRHVRALPGADAFTPQPTPGWEESVRRYAAIEGRWPA
jgi:rhamnulokinase